MDSMQAKRRCRLPSNGSGVEKFPVPRRTVQPMSLLYADASKSTRERALSKGSCTASSSSLSAGVVVGSTLNGTSVAGATGEGCGVVA